MRRTVAHGTAARFRGLWRHHKVMQYNQTDKIKEHYDLASPFYKQLWGEHLHHGYWETGKESKELAAENLVKLLVKYGEIGQGSEVLDVGCGIGGTAIWLAKHLACKVTGVTISPVQVQIAIRAAQSLPNRPTFFIADANDLSLAQQFDIIWAVEMISHLNDRDNFFRKVAGLLRAGGRMCIADWLKNDHISAQNERQYIAPIEKGMFVDLLSLAEYKKHFDNNGLRMVWYADLGPRVAKTWDIGIGLVKKFALWRLAGKHGKEIMAFLNSLQAMRRGFKAGAFGYAAIVVEKPQM